jgi:serine/threonine protein kinase/outer membrane biosynthesis protein TonB
MTPRPSESAETIAAAGPKSLKGDAMGEGQDATEVLPRLVGRYALLRMMVRGGMGEVYLATTIGIEGAERPCVVKRIRRDYRKDPSFHARFLDEARVQAQLDDPGVARVMEASVDENGDPFVVVEYVEGRSIADVRARLGKLGKPMPWADAVAMSLEIASALAHCHERTGPDGAALGIVHRDLSPQNVMVGFGGDVKLIDFGTARGENRRCHTVSGTVLAKPGYVAPEVARGESATARADIYALGVMLWELVAGRRYLDGDATEHVAKVTAGTLRPAKLAGDGLLASLGDGPAPEALDKVIAWMTEPVASARCGRARDAAQALAQVLTAAPRRPVEERGVRARVKAMLARLYPGEPAASRVDFARLVARARKMLSVDLDDAAERNDLGEGPRTKNGARSDKTLAAAEKATPADSLTGIPDALPGTRYRIVRRLGEGAMGVVFEAEHVDLGRRVAVKVLQGKHSSSPEFVARFRREARAIAGLSHPNLVQVYDFGQTDQGEMGRLFFVMEKLVGETLESYLDREKGVDWRDACELAIKTCRALEAAHAAGLVHRDLKPANLFLTYAGRPPSSLHDVGLKLLDFGVAKGSHEIGALADDPNLSSAGAIFGTPETMAPEQACAAAVDGRADLYALGCVLYHLVTGKPVFDAPSPILLMSCHLREIPKPPRAVSPERGIPAEIERVILRALEKDPAARFADASEMREALEEACYGAFFDGKSPSETAPSETAMDAQGQPGDEAIDILVELGLHDDGESREAAREVCGDGARSKSREVLFRSVVLEAGEVESPVDLDDDEEESDDEDVEASAHEETQPVSVRRRGRGGLFFAALLGFGLLGAAGWLQRETLKHTYREVLAQIDAKVKTRDGVVMPAPTTNVATKPAPVVATMPKAPAVPPTAPILASTNAAPTPAIVAPPVVAAAPEPAPVPPKKESAKDKTAKKDAPKTDKNDKSAKNDKGAKGDDKSAKDSSISALPAATAADVEARLAAGDAEGALTLARLAKADGSPASLRAWARSAYAVGRYGESHEACLSWIAKVGDDLEAKMLDARALHAASRDDEAVDRLEDVLRTHPGCGEAKSMLKDLQALHETTSLDVPRATLASPGLALK